MDILKVLFGAKASRRTQSRSVCARVSEDLERRDLLSAVTLLPDDVIMTRNYRVPGRDNVDTGFLVYRPSTQETIPLVVPKLDDPGQINDSVYILTFQLQWQPTEAGMQPHLIFGGSVVPDPGSGLSGVFDFDINSGTLTALKSEPNFGGDPDYGDFTIANDGSIVVTRETFRGFSPDPLIDYSVATLDGSQTWFHQSIYLDGSGSYQNFTPTSSLAFDNSGTLYAAFLEDDGAYFASGTQVHGNTPHPTAIYTLDPNNPDQRTPIFSVPHGEISMQFAADGSIIALIRDDPVDRYQKLDVTTERVVRIDPLTKAVTTLYTGSKRYDYDTLQLDSAGHVILSATDNAHDGNSTVFELTTKGKKKPKAVAKVLFADQPSGNAPYGVVTSGHITVVHAQPATAATSTPSTSLAEMTSSRHHHVRHHRRG